MATVNSIDIIKQSSVSIEQNRIEYQRKPGISTNKKIVYLLTFDELVFVPKMVVISLFLI